MKRFISILLIVSILLTACGNNSNASVSGNKGTDVDMDMTSITTSLAYSVLYNMLYNNPDKYIGKTVKIKGIFSYFLDENDEPKYPACILYDATACCQQGIEFVTSENNYPEVGEEIVIKGTFESYDEDGETYYHLVNAEII